MKDEVDGRSMSSVADGGSPEHTDVARAVLEWSVSLPMWQRDALRRIVTSGELSPEDEDSILTLAKMEHGLVDGGESVMATPLTAEHLPAAEAEAPDVSLLSIRDVRNVNALAAEQTLRFSRSGLTIVYGENATGKSGYARVLKRASRARDAVPILPDVLTGESPDSPRAVFKVALGEDEMELTWRDDEAAPDVLSSVVVFDSSTARVFVDEENEPRYLPYGLDTFALLAGLCTRLKARLQSEFEAYQHRRPPLAYAEGTSARELADGLGADSCPVEAAILGHLTETEENELKQLRKSQAEDPLARAASLLNQSTRVAALGMRFQKLADGLTPDQLKLIKTAQQTMLASQDAARLASARSFADEPLAGVGSTAWKLMYEAAKKYSQEAAYPAMDFPFTGSGARCVLCHQELEPCGAERMRRFEAFVADFTSTKAAGDEKAFEEICRNLSGLDSNPEKQDPTALDELSRLDSTLYQDVQTELQRLNKVKAAAVQACADADWDEVDATQTSKVRRRLATLAKRLVDEAVKSKESTDPVERERVATRLRELEARQALAGDIVQVVAAVQTARTERDLTKCIRAMNPNAITRKGGELHDSVVTDALRESLLAELRSLGVREMPLTLVHRGSYGKRLHRIALLGAPTLGDDLPQVLSEGEHRVVAIAAMLAECGVRPGRFPVVFDDPVCSLDHRYRERVAERLVEESENRQVIVLTHDIFFLTELQSRAAANGLPVECRLLRRQATRTGVCDEEKPWRTMTVMERLNWCLMKASGLRPVFEAGVTDEYEKEAGFVADRLRSTVEEVVEECVFCKVVTRFQNNVMMLRLRDVVYEDDDYRDLSVPYGILSTWTPAHSEGLGAQREVPTPDDLLEQVRLIQDYVSRLKRRQKAAAESRKD